MNIGSGDASLNGALSGGIPLLDPAVLTDLGESAGSAGIAARFAADYMEMWELRRSRLAAALGRGDLVAAMDAVISLRVSSTMVGGSRLAALAQQAEDAVSRGDLAAGRELLPAVEVCGAETVEELALVCGPGLALCSPHL